MKEILCILDYQGRFCSKYHDTPYRSGMIKTALERSFREHGYKLIFKKVHEIQQFTIFPYSAVIYSSQEDRDFRYKSFIEDVILGIEMGGGNVIPPYKFLRANNNKVFMEILRQELLHPKYQLKTLIFGCIEELIDSLHKIDYPIVVKSAKGSTSRGVRLAQTQYELIQVAKRLSNTISLPYLIKDYCRQIKHTGYRRESLHTAKFIVQEFVPGLVNDWKVLVFYNKYYVLRRMNRPNDFRASGSGLFEFDKEVDQQLLDAAKEIFHSFDVPVISLDLAKKGNSIILIEMQFVHFGTSTLERSPYYYIEDCGIWKQIFVHSILEEEYATSVVRYLQEKLN